jgi:tetratricopeptide (TPR) repeat protein
MKYCPVFPALIAFLFLSRGLLALAGPLYPQEPRLIRDTDVAEGVESTEAPVVKEPNPLLSEQNIKIGDFYLKKKNYAAAIQRYIEAVEYKPDSPRAYEALIRAYEKNSETMKAVTACKAFIEKNPDSPKASEFRTRLAKLEKKLE